MTIEVPPPGPPPPPRPVNPPPAPAPEDKHSVAKAFARSCLGAVALAVMAFLAVFGGCPLL
ncbi:hypothetical protein ACIBTP_29425 [Streptomyces avidinii]|uniref:hypothetical protein n=1 Tax=Streptomyces avidinii TaxID=1895 RepID=UPI00378DDBEA